MHGTQILFYKKKYLYRIPVPAVPLPGVRNTERQITPKTTVFHKLFLQNF